MREYDAVIGRWTTRDPKAQYFSPYRTGNNPINSVDPDGGKEFGNGYKILQAFGLFSLGSGDWFKSDRINGTATWSGANEFNLTQEKGFLEYTTIEQRASFYGWISDGLYDKGFETNWTGAAFVVASQMADLETWKSSFVSDEVIAFGKAGNEAIFNDVFDNLGALYNGPVLRGTAATAWDVATLTREQFVVVHPIYMRQSAGTLQTLEQMAKGQGIFSLGVPKELRFQGDIRNPADRFTHGMTKAVNYYTTHYWKGGR